MQTILAGTREAFGLVLFFESHCFKHKLAPVVKAQLRHGCELCRWFGLPHGHFCTLAMLMNFATGTYMAKKVLYAWSDLLNAEDAVKCASGCWPMAVTSWRYSVTDVERRLTSQPLAASSYSSRCSQTLVVFREIVSEIQAKATSKQTGPLATPENTKETLTTIDSSKDFQ